MNINDDMEDSKDIDRDELLSHSDEWVGGNTNEEPIVGSFYGGKDTNDIPAEKAIDVGFEGLVKEQHLSVERKKSSHRGLMVEDR